MKKFVKLLIILFIIIILISVFLFIKRTIEPANVTLIKDKEKIEKILIKKYPSYKIIDLQLEYTDWFSSVRSADEEHKATKATVITINESEQRTIHLTKSLFGWRVVSDQPDYGSNVPSDIYFVEITYQNVGKAVDIDNYIKTGNYWVIPDEEGKYYKKSGSDENWYYSFKYCKNIYKTKEGRVYIFNKEKASWEVATETYSYLCYYGNYEKVDMKYAMEIIEKHSSYKED